MAHAREAIVVSPNLAANIASDFPRLALFALHEVTQIADIVALIISIEDEVLWGDYDYLQRNPNIANQLITAFKHIYDRLIADVHIQLTISQALKLATFDTEYTSRPTDFVDFEGDCMLIDVGMQIIKMFVFE